MPSTPVTNDSSGGAGADEPREVEHLGLAEVEPTGLVGGVDRGHDQAGGDDDQDDAGDAEEPGEVDAHAALVDAVAEDDGEEDARAAAPTQLSVALPLAWKVGEQEDDRLESLAEHGQEGHGDQGLGRARGQGRRRPAFEVVLEVPGVPAHPEDHVGDHDDGDQADHRLEPFLLALGQIVGDDLEGDADGDADGDGDGDADPDLAQRRRRPCWPRKAATMPTMRAASRPSRSPMTNVGSILPLLT